VEIRGIASKRNNSNKIEKPMKESKRRRCVDEKKHPCFGVIVLAGMQGKWSSFIVGKEKKKMKEERHVKTGRKEKNR